MRGSPAAYSRFRTASLPGAAPPGLLCEPLLQDGQNQAVAAVADLLHAPLEGVGSLAARGDQQVLWPKIAQRVPQRRESLDVRGAVLDDD